MAEDGLTGLSRLYSIPDLIRLSKGTPPNGYAKVRR